MNKVFKVVWSKTKGMYVVVSELAKSHQNGTSKRIKGVVLSGLIGAFLLGAFGTADASLITTDESQMDLAYGDTRTAYNSVGWDSGNGVQYKLLIQGATDGGVEVKMGSYMSGGNKKVTTKSQRGDEIIENRYQVLKIGLDAKTLEKINNSSSNSQTALDELKNKANRDLDNLSEAGEKKLSDLVKGIKNGSTDLTAGSDNIKIAGVENADGSKSFSVDLNKNVDLSADGSVAVGDTKLDKSGLVTGETKVGANGILVGTTALTAGGLGIGKTVVAADGLTVAGGPSVTTAGIDAGGKKVSNVGEGAVAEGSTDAVTGGQLFGVQKTLEASVNGVKETANSALQTVTVKDTKGQTLTIDKDNAGFGIVGATEGMVESKVDGQNMVVDLTDATKEKINNAAGKDLGNLDDKGKTVIKEVVQESVDVIGGNNIAVVDAVNAEGVKTFTVNLNKNIDLGADGSVTAGDTKLDKSGLEIGDTAVTADGLTAGTTKVGADGVSVGDTALTDAGLAIAGGPSVTKDGINAGGKVVGNLGEGAVAAGSTDAVTGGQLFGVQKTLEDSVKGVKDTANSALQNVTVTDTKGQTLVVNKDNAGFGIVGATNGMVESTVNGQNLVVDLTDATKEKINNAAGKDLGNLDDKGKTVIKEVVQESVDVTGGNNIEVANAVNSEGVKTFTVNMKNNVDLGANGSIKAGATTLDNSGLATGATKVGADGVTVGDAALTDDGVSVGDAALTTDGLAIVGGPSVTKDGIDAGGKVVGNLGEGVVAAGSTDAVTGGQLFGVQKTLEDSVSGVKDTANSALQTVTVKDTKGQTLTIDKDNAGFGIVGATNGMVESAVDGQNLVVDLTAATKEKINNAAGKDLGNLDDKGKTVIKEVVQESVDVTGGNNIEVADAVNSEGVKTFTVNMKNNIDLGANGSIKAGETTLDNSGLTAGTTKVGADGVTVGDAALTTDGVSVGDAALTEAGLAIVGGPSVTKDGINAGGKVAGNLGEGAVAAGSTDAVTGGQLFGVQKTLEDSVKGVKDTANSALQTVTVKDTKGQTLTIDKDNAGFGIVGATNGMVESKVDGQNLVVDLTDATKEKINNAAGKDLGNLDDKGKTVIKEVVQESVDVTGGNNIEVADAVNAEGVKTFTVNMKNNVDLGANGSIKAGTTTLDNSGLTAGVTKVGADGVTVGDAALTAEGVNVGDAALTESGLAIAGGPSVTKDGINAGGKVVGNLGEGAVAEGSKDAVTGGQLFGVQKALEDSVSGVKDTANSALQTVTVKDSKGQTIEISKDNAGLGIVSATDGMVETTANGQDLVVDLTAATKEKINNAAGKDLGNLDDKGKTVIKEVVQNAVDVAGGNNIEVTNATTDEGVKTFTVNMKNNVDLGANGSIKAGATTLDNSGLTAGATKVGADGVTVGDAALTADGVTVGDASLTEAGLAIVGGPSVTKDGINAGGKVVGNLGEGSVTEGSKDAVTGGQLYGVKTDLDGKVNTITNNLETVTNDLKTVKETAGSALQTVTVKDSKGQTIEISKDNAGFGIVSATNGMVETTANGQDLVVDLTAATKEKINNAAGKDLGNLDDKGKTVIKEVVQNAVDVEGGTNINVDKATVNDVKTFTVNLNKNVDLGSDGSISLGDTIIKSGDVRVGGTTITNGGVTLVPTGEFKVGDTVINGSSVNVGGTTLNQGGLTINNGPSITVDGINANNTKITNVTDGTKSGDVVTYNQLLEVRKIAENNSGTSGSALQSVQVKDTEGNAITVSKSNASFGIVAATDGMVQSTVDGQNLVVDLTDATKTKINNAAGKDLGNLDDKGKEVIKEVVEKSVDVAGGNNIEVAEGTNSEGVKTFTVNMKNNVDLGATGSITAGTTTLDANGLTAGATKVGINGVSVGDTALTADGVTAGDASLTTDGLAIVGGPSVTKDGVNAGGKVVSNLGEGSVAEGSKDAVTGGQLYGVKTDLEGKVTTITNSLEKVTETAGSALQSVSINDGKDGVITVNKDKAGFGIKGATDGMVESNVVGQDLVVDLTAATKEKINNAAGKDLGNLDDKGKTVIKEVVQNAVDVEGGNNIEVTDATTAEGVKTFTVNMKNNVDLGATGSIKAGTTTLDGNGLTTGATKVGTDGVTVGDAALTADGVSVGDASLTEAGLAIVGGPSVTKDGINAGGKVVGNLGEGAVAAGSTDAVTGGQLYGVKTDLDGKVNTITNNLETVTNDLKTVKETAGSALQTVTVKDSKGQTIEISKDNAGFGIVSATNGMVETTANGQDLVVDLTAATKEKINNAAGKDLGNLDDKGKTVIKEVVQDAVDVTGGTNITVDKATVNDVKTFTVNLNKNVDLGADGSISLGDTVINGSSVNVGGTVLNQGGLTINNGPSITVDGINAKNTKITNVVDGSQAGDVVTYNQLLEVRKIAESGSGTSGTALQTVSVKDTNGNAITVNKDNAGFGIVAATDGMVESKVDGQNLVVDLNTDAKNKINNAAGKDLGNLDDKGKEVIKEVVEKSVDVAGGNNIEVAEGTNSEGVKTFTVNMKNNVDLGANGSIKAGTTTLDNSGLTAGTTTVSADGVTAGETKLDESGLEIGATSVTADGMSVGSTAVSAAGVTAGDAALTTNGLTIANGPSVTKDGINAGGKVVSNLGEGSVAEGSKDAVTGGQLFGVKTDLEGKVTTITNNLKEVTETAGNALQSVAINDGKDGVITVNKDKAGFGIKGATDGMVESNAVGQDLVLDLTAATKEKINNAADKNLNNLGDGGKEVIKEIAQASVDVVGTNNVSVSEVSKDAGTKKFIVTLNNNIDLGNTGSVTTGSTTLNNNGLTIADGPSVTKDGIDAGGTVVSNLGDGSVAEGSKDAVTGGQLYAVDQKVNTVTNNVETIKSSLETVKETAGSALQSVTVKDSAGNALAVNKENATFGIVGATDGMVTSSVDGQNMVVDLTTEAKNKINNAAGKDLGNLDDKGKEVIKEVVQKSVDVKGGDNIEVTSATGSDDVKTFTVNMKNNVDLGANGSIKAGTTTVSADGVTAGATKLSETGLAVGATSVTADGVTAGTTKLSESGLAVGNTAVTTNGLVITDGPSVTKSGINAGGTVVSNLGEGTVAEGSTDAVTGGQLYGVKTDLDNKVNTVTNEVNNIKTDVGTLKTEVTTVKNDVGTLKTEVNTVKTDVGTLKTEMTTVKTDVGTIRTDVNNLTDRVTTVENTAGSALQTVTVTDSEGNKLTVNKANAGFGIVGADKGMVESKVSGQDLVVDLTADAKNKINNAVGKDLGDLDDKGKEVIKEVIQDAVDVVGGNNINVDKATVDGVKKFTVNLDSNLDLGGEGSITLGDTIIKSGDLHVGDTTINSGGVTLNSTGEFKVGDTVINGSSINVGGTTLNQGGLTIKNGPTINVGGINMGGTKITNVANATEEGDVVTYNQLQEVKNIATEGSELAGTALQTVTVKGNDGQTIAISKSNSAIGIVGAADGMVESKVSGNDLVVDLTAPTKEKINNAADKDLSNLSDDGKDVIKEVSQNAVDVAGGNNITVDKATVDDVKTFTVNLNKDLNLGGEGSITLGDTVIKSGDVNIGGTTINQGGVTLVPTGEFKVGDTVINGGSINVAGTTINEGGITVNRGGITVNPQGNIVLGDTTISNGGLTIKNGPTINVGGINAGGTKITNVLNGTEEGDVVTYNQLQEVKNIAEAGSELANSALQTISISDGNGGVITVNKGQAAFGVTGNKAGGMVESKVDGQNLVVDLTAATKEKINNAADKDLSNLSDKGKDVIKETSQNAVNVTGGSNITVNTTDVNGVKTYDVNLNNQVDLGTTGSVKAGGTTVDNNGVSVGSSTLNGNGLAVGDTKVSGSGLAVGDVAVSNSGLSITGGPSVTKDGIDAGNKVISNIADGVNAGDAVNKGQLDKVDSKVTDLGTKVSGLDTRVSGVEKGLSDLGTKVDGLGQDVKDLGTKVGNLDTKVGALDTKVGNLDTKVTDLDNTVKGFDGRITDVEKVAGSAMQGISVGTDTNNKEERVNLTKDKNRMDIVGATDHDGNKSIVTAVEGNKVTVDLTKTVKDKIDNAATKSLNNLDKDGKAVIRDLLRARGLNAVEVDTQTNAAGQKTFRIGLSDDALMMLTRSVGWGTPGVVTTDEETTEQPEERSTFRLSEGDWRNPTSNGNPYNQTLAVSTDFKIREGALDLADDVVVAHSVTVGETSMTTDGIYVGGTTSLTKDALTVQDSALTNDTLVLGGTTLATHSSDTGLITLDNVAQGSISESSNQAITGAQLYPIKTQVDNNTAAIGVIGEVVNAQGQAIQGLSSEIQGVRNESAEGDAMAASLAALNPLPYAEGERGQIMAGVGTYKGKQAMAVGYAYAPNSDQQYTVGLSYGQGGKAMANMGATFRIGSGETTKPGSSVAAVQNKVQALEAQNKAQQAKFDAELAAKQSQIDAQNERIAKLEALVQQLVH